MVILMQVGRVPKSLLNFKPIRELCVNFNSNRVLGLSMIYNIYKFQEKYMTKKASLHFHFHSLHNQNLRFFSLRRVEVDAEDKYGGLGTVRARLGQVFFSVRRIRYFWYDFKKII